MSEHHHGLFRLDLVADLAPEYVSKSGVSLKLSFVGLMPLALMNSRLGFVEPSFLVVMLIATLVFSLFNFRPKGNLSFLNFCIQKS